MYFLETFPICSIWNFLSVSSPKALLGLPAQETSQTHITIPAPWSELTKPLLFLLPHWTVLNPGQMLDLQSKEHCPAEPWSEEPSPCWPGNIFSLMCKHSNSKRASFSFVFYTSCSFYKGNELNWIPSYRRIEPSYSCALEAAKQECTWEKVLLALLGWCCLLLPQAEMNGICPLSCLVCSTILSNTACTLFLLKIKMGLM